MVNTNILTDFSDDCRIWIYGFRSDLSPSQSDIINKALNNFEENWMSHQSKVRGAHTIEYSRFLILTGECTTGISGCAIDASVRALKEIRDHHQLDGLNCDLIYFRNPKDGISSVERVEFQRLIDAGKVDSSTVVFNTSIQILGELRSGMWETCLTNSWHGRAFNRLPNTHQKVV